MLNTPQTILEHIRLRPKMSLSGIPTRELFKWLIAAFVGLHIDGRTKRIRITVERESLTIRSFGCGFPFSTLRRLQPVNMFRVKPQFPHVFRRGCAVNEENTMLMAAAFSRTFRVSSVWNGRMVVCSCENQQNIVCRETSVDAPPGSEVYLELDTAFLHRVYSSRLFGNICSLFEPEYIRYLVDEKNALHPDCEFVLNGTVLPHSMGLFDLLLRSSEATEELALLGIVKCLDDALALAVAYDWNPWGNTKGAKKFFVNGEGWLNGHMAHTNGCAHPFPEICRRGIESGVADVMLKLRGKDGGMRNIHWVCDLRLSSDDEGKCSYEAHRRNCRSAVYWALLHELFPYDEESSTSGCFFTSSMQCFNSFMEFQKDIWRRLEPLDKSSLISIHPELFELVDEPLLELTPDNWLNILACQPQLEKHFDWSLVEKRPSISWDFLLRRQPQFADRCDFSQLKSHQLRRILMKQPQFVDRVDWSKLEPADREKLEAKGITP